MPTSMRNWDFFFGKCTCGFVSLDQNNFCISFQSFVSWSKSGRQPEFGSNILNRLCIYIGIGVNLNCPRNQFKCPCSGHHILTKHVTFGGS